MELKDKCHTSKFIKIIHSLQIMMRTILSQEDITILSLKDGPNNQANHHTSNQQIQVKAYSPRESKRSLQDILQKNEKENIS